MNLLKIIDAPDSNYQRGLGDSANGGRRDTPTDSGRTETAGGGCLPGIDSTSAGIRWRARAGTAFRPGCPWPFDVLPLLLS